MPLTVSTQGENVTPPEVQPPVIAVSGQSVVVSDAEMIAALEADGYGVTAPGSTSTTPPPTTAVMAGIGLYNNGTSASALGVKPTYYADYADGSTSTGFSVSEALEAKPEELVLRVGKLTAAQATALAQDCQANQPTAIIAPMWEYNQHGWFALWNQTALTIAQFQSEWEEIVNAMRSVCPTLRFALVSTADINMTSNDAPGRSEFDTFLAGTDSRGLPWVNIIGIDCYDNNGSVAASQACISSVSTFAGAHGCEWAIFEWGMYNNVDDPAFVEMIATVTAVPGCLFQALFSLVGATSGSGSDITKAPKSLAAYKAAFGTAA